MSCFASNGGSGKLGASHPIVINSRATLLGKYVDTLANNISGAGILVVVAVSNYISSYIFTANNTFKWITNITKFIDKAGSISAIIQESVVTTTLIKSVLDLTGFNNYMAN